MNEDNKELIEALNKHTKALEAMAIVTDRHTEAIKDYVKIEQSKLGYGK